jgi:hypothetical protein
MADFDVMPDAPNLNAMRRDANINAGIFSHCRHSPGVFQALHALHVAKDLLLATIERKNVASGVQ